MQSLKEKLTCGFKYDMQNLVNFYPTTQKSENVTPMKLSLSLMALNSDAKFEKPCPCGFKNGMKNWVSFHY